MKCPGCGHINEHERTVCGDCGKTLEDWNRQSVLRSAAVKEAPARPSQKTSKRPPAAPPQTRAQAPAPAPVPPAPASPPYAPTTTKTRRAAYPSTGSSMPRAQSTPPAPHPWLQSEAPAPSPVTPSGLPASTVDWIAEKRRKQELEAFSPPAASPADKTETFTPPSALPQSGRFTVPDIHGSASAETSTDGTPQQKQLLRVALGFRGVVNGVGMLLATWFGTSLFAAFMFGGSASALRDVQALIMLVLYVMMFLALRRAHDLVDALGYEQQSRWVYVGMLNLPLAFMGLIALWIMSLGWLLTNNVDVGIFGPDADQLSRLKKKAAQNES